MTTALDRSLRYHRKQIEQLIYAVNAALDQHISAETCVWFDNADLELARLRAQYSETVEKILLGCSDEEFEEKCDSLTEAQDSLFESCRLLVARSKAEIAKFKGNKSRESLSRSALAADGSILEQTQVPSHYPKIKIPTFSGDYRQFMRFRGIFVNLVHDAPNMSNIRKLYYLQEALEGDAARLIEDLPMTENAYEEAWSRILSRYDNQKALVMIYFRELLSIKRIEQPSELRVLIDTVTNALNNLKLCDLPADNWGDLVAYMVYQCLDSKTKDDFDSNQAESTKYFSWKTLHGFLKGRAYCSETRILAETEIPRFTPITSKSETVAKSKASDTVVTPSKSSFVTVTREKCVSCGEHHLLIACATFAKLTPRQRFDLISQQRMCINCFGRSHLVKECEGRGSCKQCGQKHHTLLHFPKVSKPAEIPVTSPKPTATPVTSEPAQSQQSTAAAQPVQTATPTTVLVPSAEAQCKTILLPTAIVKIRVNAERVITARALLDSCSQVNLVSENLVKKFQLPTQNKMQGHTSFTGATSGIVNVSSICHLTLGSRFSPFQLPVTCDVVPQTTLKYSVSGMPLPAEYKPIRKFPLADPAFAKDPMEIPPPDILLGAEYFEACLLNNTSTVGSLNLRQSHFGWLVIGAVNSNWCAPLTTAPPFCLTICQIEQQLKKFCELEDVAVCEEDVTDEKRRCDEHFEQTHSRHTDGKFLTKMPKRTDRGDLVFNAVAAARQLCWSERNRDPQVEPDYIDFMQEYEDLSHMTEITPENGLRADYLIPHHAVLRPSSSTTRTRVVFNASSKTASGVSLNDILMVGPRLQPDLFDLLIKFRQHKVAYTADIAKMYRCVWVHPEDRPLQCILWRKSPTDPIKSYQLNTLTYGTAPASFIATKCLQKLAQAVSDFPEASNAIATHFYMDDILSGSESVEKCKQLQVKVHETLAGAGFVLRKYQCNSREIMLSLPPELRSSDASTELTSEAATSVLGICWRSQADVFTLKVNKSLTQRQPVTRRSLLSDISRTFDPLGFSSPVTIRAKVFMQRVWCNSSSWDEPVDSQLAADFTRYWEETQDLEKFSLPRPYFAEYPAQSMEMIGFCDASELAYCAVVYIRSTDMCGKVSVNFVCSKTRVAPIKRVSIPRLELQAAWLLAQLVFRLTRVLKLSFSKVLAFTDSKVVLSWLAKPPSTWTIFVRNRVAKIKETLPYENWAYVSTNQNPADLATRGISVKKFLKATLWVKGPPFLCTNFSTVSFSEDVDLEKRKSKSLCNVVLIPEYDNFVVSLQKFSSYNRLVRVLAFMLRFVKNCKNRLSLRKTRSASKKNVVFLPISNVCVLDAEELSWAESRLFFVIQYSVYRNTYARLFQVLPLQSKDPLKSLCPFIDDQGLMRVGGRLRNSQLPFEKKHPLILPVKSSFTQLLIRHVHKRFFHAQKSFVMAHLRSKFWFHGHLVNAVKNCIRNCITCIRYNHNPIHQLMGDLPEDRVVPSRPFSKVGVDFAGPFTTKCVGHRSTVRFKTYISVFVCLVTRAVHLEVVSQLSSDHFLMCLSRFVSRRGSPSLIRSDNGTNFVGASSFLQLSSSNIADYSAEHRIRWLFNPPRSPHRGGIWESAVKSMKSHLLRSCEGQVFTFEEFATVVAKVESILNSRPLATRVSADQEKTLITPAHFLIGDSLLSEPIPENATWSLAKRFEIVSRVSNAVWKNWHKDYLAQLQSRAKWKDSKLNLGTGDLVIMRDEQFPPNQWPISKVLRVFPDSQGRVRTAEVLVDGTKKIRDSSKLIPLPLDNFGELPVHPGGV